MAFSSSWVFITPHPNPRPIQMSHWMKNTTPNFLHLPWSDFPYLWKAIPSCRSGKVTSYPKLDSRQPDHTLFTTDQLCEGAQSAGPL